MHGIIILSLRIELIERSVLCICDDSWVFCLFICASLSLFHRSNAPFGRPPASLKKLLNSPTLSLTLPRSFSHSASLCLLFLTLLQSKTQNQKAFSLNAGVTKGVPSPATQRGIKLSAGATESRSSVVLLSCYCGISLCVRSNSDSGC